MKNTAGWKQVEKELEIIRKNLESKINNELNAPVYVLLEDSKIKRTELEDKTIAPIYSYLNKLKESGLNERQKDYLNVLESNIRDIIATFSHKSDHSLLTYCEMQVANLVKEGKLSKEIADILCISEETVNTHRRRIRKKLGITNKNHNLRSYLLSIQ